MRAPLKGIQMTCNRTSHTVKHHQLPVERKEVTFIEPAMWPANSPDLNLVDYAVWGALQQRVYCDDCLKLWKQLKQVILDFVQLSRKYPVIVMAGN